MKSALERAVRLFERLTSGWRHDRAADLLLEAETLKGSCPLVLQEMADFCHFTDRMDFTDPSGRVDPSALLIAEGRRQAYLHLLQLCEAPDELYQKLRQQALDDD